MSDLFPSPPAQPPATTPQPAHSPLLQNLLTAASSFAAALLILAATEWDYAQALRYGFLRTDCLIAAIITGIAATICLAGTMYFLNRTLATPLRWYWRALLATHVRLLMFLQLATTALALGAAGLLIFDKPIPGTAREAYIQQLAPPPAGE